MLSLADAENPELMIDFATLTGARGWRWAQKLCRFTPMMTRLRRIWKSRCNVRPDVASAALDGYDGWLDSQIADVNHISSSPMAGSITAALFLSRFVENTTSWMHCDVYAWNIKSRAGRPSVAKLRPAGDLSLLKELMADPSSRGSKPQVNPWRDDLAAEHLRGEIDAPVMPRPCRCNAPVTALRAPAHGAMMYTAPVG